MGSTGCWRLWRSCAIHREAVPGIASRPSPSIAPYTIEEAYEVADAIARNEPDALVDELGDLLFQVVFHAQMASESDWFGFDDVVDAIVDKMQRRHPHVFGDAQVADATEQTREWEAQKAAERRAQARTAGTPNSALSELDGVPVWTRSSRTGAKTAEPSGASRIRLVALRRSDGQGGGRA